MSYLAHKSLMFREARDIAPVRKRSDGRMKTYPSVTDARAWGDDGEDRRQYILDLIKADHEKVAFGKYVPIEVLIDTLMANKNADIARLREQVDELDALLDIYSKLDLTEDQKRKLNTMKQQMGKAGGGLDVLSTKSSIKSRSPRGADTDLDTTELDTEDESRSTCSRSTTCSGMSRATRSVKSAQMSTGQSGKGPYDGLSNSELIALLMRKDEELAAKQAECEQQSDIARTAIEQLENLRDIMQERDELKKKLDDSLHELQTLKKRFEDPCVQEIAALENEIERLRTKGQLSQEEEAEVIRKEVEVLKKYCTKLSSIQEENQRLTTQLDRLQELSGIPKDYKDDSPLPDNPAELKKLLKELRMRFANLQEIMDDRDKCRVRVKQLETELLKYGDLPEEIEIFKQRSQMLDEVIEDRTNLQQRLNKLKGIEDELKAIKAKADRVDEMECLLCCTRRNAALELENLKSQKDAEIRYRMKEAEVLRIEKDRLAVRIDQLSAIESEYLILLDKCRSIENIKAERETYKQKYEELLGLECECDMLRAQVERYKQLDREREALLRQIRDCECCIADQEDEIKRLVAHIDHLSQGTNEQQDRMHRALSDMRAEIEQKNSLIASSEEQLAGVQDQLKGTIAEVSSETTCLKTRIEELEVEVNEKDRIIDSLKDELSKLISTKEKLQKELDAATDSGGLEGDQHLQLMLKQSKCAVKRVAEELSKQYDEWDRMQEGGIVGVHRGSQADDGLRDEMEKANATITGMSQQLGNANATIGGLSQKLENANATIEELRRQLEAANSNVEGLRQELEKGNATMEDMRQQLTEAGNLARENDALRRHSSEAQALAKQQIEQLTNDLQADKDRIKQLEAELEAKNAAGDQLRSRVAELETEKSKLEGNMTELESQLRSSISESEELKEEAKRIAAASRRKSTQMGELASENKELKGDNDSLRKQLDDLMRDVEKQKKETATAAEMTLEQLERERKEKEDLEDMIKSLQDQINNMEAAVGSSQDAVNEALAKLTKQLEEEQARAATAEATVNKLQGEYASNKEEDLKKMRDQIKALEDELAAQKKECADTIQTMKSQYDRDIKSINNKYNDGIAKLQGSHEEILKDVSREFEKEVDSLRSELRKSKEEVSTLESKRDGMSLSMTTVENVDIKGCNCKSKKSQTEEMAQRGVCTCGSYLKNALNKVIQGGFQSLTFEELQFLHANICEAINVCIAKNPSLAPPPLEPITIAPEPIKLPEHEPSKDSGKLSLIQRLSGLEGELANKQNSAQQKVGALQVAVKMEKERLEDLKKVLEAEKQRNNELMVKVGAQSRAVASMQVERDMMRQQNSFHEEKLSEVKTKYEEESVRVRNLEDDLNKAKQKQKRDSEALESMRIKLEKSLNNEMVLKMQLDQRMEGESPPQTCEILEEPRPTFCSHASTFYTELTVEDIRKKRNFVHHCSMKHRDYPAEPECRCAPPALPYSCKCSDTDD